MANDAAANQIGSSAPMREKFWHERDREEKLEGLREAVAQLFHTVQGMRDTVQALTTHQHSTSGELMAPLDHRLPTNRMHWLPPALNNELPRPKQQEPYHGKA